MDNPEHETKLQTEVPGDTHVNRLDIILHQEIPEQTPSQSTGKFLTLAEQTVKIAGVFGAFGYMALRSHLNYLGIPASSSLGIERYLMEIYSLVVVTFTRLVFPLLGLLILLMLLAPLRRTFSKMDPLSKRLQDWADHPSMPMTLLSTLIVIMIATIMSVPLQRLKMVDVVVGPLKASNLTRLESGWIYDVLCILCLTGYSIYFTYSPKASQPLARFLWSVSAFALLLPMITIPLLYGRLLHSTEYPKAVILLQDKKENTEKPNADPLPTPNIKKIKKANSSPPKAPQKILNGLLLLETEKQVVLYQAQQATGQAVIIPREQIERIKVYQLEDILKYANETGHPK